MTPAVSYECSEFACAYSIVIQTGDLLLFLHLWMNQYLLFFRLLFKRFVQYLSSWLLFWLKFCHHTFTLLLLIVEILFNHLSSAALRRSSIIFAAKWYFLYRSQIKLSSIRKDSQNSLEFISGDSIGTPSSDFNLFIVNSLLLSTINHNYSETTQFVWYTHYDTII